MHGTPGSGRRSSRNWLLAWLGGVVIAIVNGTVRERSYAPLVGDDRSHQISCFTAIAAFAAWFCVLQRRWPLRSGRQALAIGAAWTALTIAFEFTYGRLVARQSWRALLADYDLRRGRLWPLVLAWLMIGPATVRAACRHR